VSDYYIEAGSKEEWAERALTAEAKLEVARASKDTSSLYYLLLGKGLLEPLVVRSLKESIIAQRQVVSGLERLKTKAVGTSLVTPSDIEESWDTLRSLTVAYIHVSGDEGLEGLPYWDQSGDDTAWIYRMYEDPI